MRLILNVLLNLIWLLLAGQWMAIGYTIAALRRDGALSGDADLVARFDDVEGFVDVTPEGPRVWLGAWRADPYAFGAAAESLGAIDVTGIAPLRRPAGAYY